MNIKILDCTLRDGAHVNKGLFGLKEIRNIIKNLVDAKIDIIEIGFLQDIVNNKDYAESRSDVINVNGTVAPFPGTGCYYINRIMGVPRTMLFWPLCIAASLKSGIDRNQMPTQLQE